jgi:hypothetical protein
VRQPVHVRLLDPVRLALRASGTGPVVVARVGIAAADAGCAAAGPRLEAFLDRAAAAALLRGGRMPERVVAAAWAELDPDGQRLARHAATELPSLRAAATAVSAGIRRSGARVVVTYDEVGRWGRLLAEAARHAGVPSVDLPHAESVDPEAMRGMGYDRIAVFGPVSAERVERAGVEPERIVVVGSPGLDALVERAQGVAPVEPRRIVFASQYVAGVMTAEVKERTVATAMEAVTIAAPCELVGVPHPVERDDTLSRLLSSAVPPGVRTRVAPVGSLHDELIGAWLLVTGSSQSVIEATAAGVPSLTINRTGGPDPVPYASEGMSLGAESDDEARAAIGSLLDPATRSAVLSRAVASLERHVGPLDGGAARRIADLIAGMAASRSIPR